MSKKKKRKVAKRTAGAKTRKKPATEQKINKEKATADKARSRGKVDHERMDGIAERLRLGAQGFRADVDTLLKEVRKGGVKPSSKARKVLAAVARDYRKAAKGLKKLSSGKR